MNAIPSTSSLLYVSLSLCFIITNRSQSFRQGPLHSSNRSQSRTSCNVNQSISAHPLLPIETGLYYFYYVYFSYISYFFSFCRFFVSFVATLFRYVRIVLLHTHTHTLTLTRTRTGYTRACTLQYIQKYTYNYEYRVLQIYIYVTSFV